MVIIDHRRAFGRWGELAVAAAYRRRGFKVFVGDAYNIDDYRDLVVEKKSWSTSVQVKSTAQAGKFYRLKIPLLRRYLETRQERHENFGLCIVSLRLGNIFSFPADDLEPILAREEERLAADKLIGGTTSLFLDVTAAPRRVLALTAQEITEGILRAKGMNKSDLRQISLFDDEF